MKKILILSNNDGGLYHFRKELLYTLNKDYEVFISLPYGTLIPNLQELGCKHINTILNRRSVNPFTDFILLIKYIRIINEIKPDVVLTYTIKPNIYGGIACRLLSIPYICNITGLGSSLQHNSIIKKITLLLYKIGLKKSSCVFFQNLANFSFFKENKIIHNNYRLVPGSGVNIEHFTVEPYPDEKNGIFFLFIGRIMKEKGIIELIDAAKQIKKKYHNINFDIIGHMEDEYMKILTEAEDIGIIKYHQSQKDVRHFIRKSHATILPSYHEGTANVLLESASSGRPVLASCIPGCMETFDDNISGFSFEAKNVESLVNTIDKFLKLSNQEKKEMGLAGRKKIEKEFNRTIVINAYLDEINKITQKEGINEAI